MGSGKKQTIGYHYRWAKHFAWCRAADALLEFRAGGATAWSGRIESNTTLVINQPELWGGEKGEGGMVGEMEILFGGPDQAPSSYLAGVFGPKQSGNRGIVSTFWRGGRYGAFVPNPKTLAAKLERIFSDWRDGEVWYPEKAAVPVGDVVSDGELGPTSPGWKYLQLPLDNETDYSAENFDDSGWAEGASPFASNPFHPYVIGAGFPQAQGTAWALNTRLWIRRRFSVQRPADVALTIFVDNYCTVWVNGVLVLPRSGTNTDPSGPVFTHAVNIPQGVLRPGQNQIAVLAEDFGTYSYAALRIEVGGSGAVAMNPAHMIYEAATHPEMKGDPIGLIDDDSLRAFADLCYAEGFGLCTSYDSDRETPEQFIQRVCNVVGANFVFDRRVGRWFVDPIREIADPSALPVIGEADIDLRAFDARPSVITETVNCVRVEWRDQERNEVRLTAPVYAMGHIRSAGEVISEIRQYHEIPTESLALRVAQRDLTTLSAPVIRFEIPLLRPRRDIRYGADFRLEVPSRGIASTVCRLGQIKEGTHNSSRTVIVAVQVATSLPDTVHVQPSPGDWVPPSTVPVPPVGPVAIEAPYVELASALPNSELAALLPDAGFLLTAAAPPASALNYAIYTATGAEELESRATADWSPSAVVTSAYGPEDAVIEIEAAALLDRAAIGTWVLWDDELCRLDAKDTEAGTVTLGRGCADTVSATHAAGSRLYLCGDWVGSDQREYVDSEVIRARLLTRTTSGELPLGAATELTITMASRQARPYPPARIRINGEAWPSALFGELKLTGAHRDRLLQADQLVDQEEADVGPEPGTTYSVRWYIDDALEREQTGLSAPADTWTPTAEGLVRVEVEAVRDGLASWQRQVRQFTWTEDEVVSLAFITEAGDPLVTEAGDPLITE